MSDPASMRRACPASPLSDCPDDETCDRCLEFITTCDECHIPGHTDSTGWYLQSDGRLLCSQCANGEKP